MCVCVWGGGGGGAEGIVQQRSTTLQLMTKFNFRSFLLFVRQAFSKIGPLLSAVIAKKKDPKKPG